MAGTKVGGKKAAAKNLEKNPNFYSDIGEIGGKKSRGGGFATPIPCECDVIPFSHVISNCAGIKGGRKSKRKKVVYGE